MGHSYYNYTKEELVGNDPKLPVIVMEDNAAVFHSMAVEMVDEIKMHNAKGEKTVFICPVGPVGQYPYFVDMVNEQNISLKDVWFINMDEYLDDEKQWVSKDHPLSFRGFMQRTVSLTNEEFLAQKTRVLEITKETRTANAIGDFNGALEDMPHYCVTIGIYEISHARKIRLGCFRNWHRAVVRRTAYGEATSDFPVSLLTSHPDINLKITEFVAALD